jgi:predicted nucleotidyltransferase
MTTAFLTGSRAYGTPQANSDTDICLLMSFADIDALASQAPHSDEDGSGDGSDVSLRFGKLNLICMSDPAKFEAWREATAELAARRPVTRQEAIDLIDQKLDVVWRDRREAAAEANERAWESLEKHFAEVAS